MSNSLSGITDVLLAPVVLGVDARIDELSGLDRDELALRVALDADISDWTREMREEALLLSIQHLVALHDWTLSWDSRGLRLSHGHHSLVLGVPASFDEYLAGDPSSDN